MLAIHLQPDMSQTRTYNINKQTLTKSLFFRVPKPKPNTSRRRNGLDQLRIGDPMRSIRDFHIPSERYNLIQITVLSRFVKVGVFGVSIDVIPSAEHV
jgi:hypothetical protein